MYNNIGGKIKNLAFGTFLSEAIGSFTTGIVLTITGLRGDDTALLLSGFLTLLLGPVVAWVSSWLLYGFGQLISNTDDIVYMMRSDRDIVETKKTIKTKTEIKEPEKAPEAPTPTSSLYKTAPQSSAPQPTAFQSNSQNGKPCPYCKTIISSKVCPKCRKENNLF